MLYKEAVDESVLGRLKSRNRNTEPAFSDASAGKVLNLEPETWNLPGKSEFFLYLRKILNHGKESSPDQYKIRDPECI